MKFKIRSQLNPIAPSAIMRILVISCMLFFAAVPAAAQDNISGVWATDLSTGDGNILRAYLDLKQSGDQLTGAFCWPTTHSPSWAWPPRTRSTIRLPPMAKRSPTTPTPC